jgi:hypothetical protein
LAFAALGCGSDGSGGKAPSENPANGDGDNTHGDGDNGASESDGGGRIPVPGDGDGTSSDGGQAPMTCETGTTRPCDCDDGKSQGEQYCIQGQYVGACNNCPCMAGDTQACFCKAGGIGSAQCVDNKFGDCECQAGGACPDGFNCQDLSQLGMGMGAACLPSDAQGPGGFGLPPQCKTQEDCATAGLPNATCSQVQIIPFKLCIQSCTVEQPQPDPTADAGT